MLCSKGCKCYISPVKWSAIPKNLEAWRITKSTYDKHIEVHLNNCIQIYDLETNYVCTVRNEPISYCKTCTWNYKIVNWFNPGSCAVSVAGIHLHSFNLEKIDPNFLHSGGKALDAALYISIKILLADGYRTSSSYSNSISWIHWCVHSFQCTGHPPGSFW